MGRIFSLNCLTRTTIWVKIYTTNMSGKHFGYINIAKFYIIDAKLGINIESADFLIKFGYFNVLLLIPH